MPSDRPSPFADLWSLLHEGGIAVETRTGGDETPVALRTLLQADGDRVVWIGRNALAPLAPYQRLRLAVRHRRAVRARTIVVLGRIRRALERLRYAAFAALAGSEGYRAYADWPLVQLDWRTLLWRQVPNLVLLAVGIVGPMLIRLVAPYVLRWLASGIIQQRVAGLRHASQVFAQGLDAQRRS